MKRQATTYTATEMRALLAACSGGRTGRRNRALIVLMWRAGLRCAETLALRPSDIDRRRCLVKVRRGKGHKARTVAIDRWGLDTVELWEAVRPDIRGPLICTLDGRPVQPQYVRALCGRLGRRAGLDKRVHPHGFRHTHALELSREGVPLPVIRDQLGHSSVATTDHYLRAHSPVEIEQLALQRKPPDVD